uniref:Seroin 3 n=1 Tax=Antheraea yamamai TaxID=7121 RepID=A0A3G1T160_ANTYA|nr:seroin 3 [Antheraea yamamai]
MSKLIIVVVMAVAFYVTEANPAPNAFDPINNFAPFNPRHFPIAHSFESVRALRPEEGGQVSGMAISTSTRDDGAGGSVSQGRVLVNKNGKLYETSFRKK